jgi:hypothetical protein
MSRDIRKRRNAVMMRLSSLLAIVPFLLSGCGAGATRTVPPIFSNAVSSATCSIKTFSPPYAPAYATTTWPSEHHDPWRTHAVATGLPSDLRGTLRVATAQLPPAPVWGYVGLDGNIYVLGGSPYLLDVFTKLILGAPPSTLPKLVAESVLYSRTVTPYVARVNPSTMAVRTLNLTKVVGVNYIGGMLVDSNGYIYAVARGVLYKIDPQALRIVAFRRLPLAPNKSGKPNKFTAYNGMQATLNGDLILKGFASLGGGPGIFLRIDPNDLSIKAKLQSEQIAASRMTLVTVGTREFVYLVGATDSTRFLLKTTSFVLDKAYSRQYLYPSTGDSPGSSDAFMGRGVIFSNNTEPDATSPMSLFAQGASDASQLRSQLAFTGTGAGWDFFMVAGDPFSSGIVAVEDQVSGHISAFTVCDGGISTKKLWENDAIDGSAGLAIDDANGQLYADDRKCVRKACSLWMIVLDLHTGRELGRAKVAGNEPTIGQIFIGPKHRVFYLATDTDRPHGFVTRVTAP